MSAGYLSLRRLVKSYDGRSNAVDDVSLDIIRGEFVTLLGPSGSGKTTTLMMIAGFEEPTAGSIHLDGRPLAGAPPYRRNIGVVFQSYALFPHMTARRNVEFPLLMRRLASADVRARVDRVLGLVGLGAFAGYHPRELSGGQQQRVALARALVFEPDVLLLDEPLGALDKNLREQMQVEIKRIHREVGITAVYVTHDQTEAMTMSDRIVVFNRGRIEQAAPPLEVYTRPATRFVAEFVGDSNLLEGLTVAGGVRVERLGAMLDAGGSVRPAGERVDLLIRPERIRILDELSPREGLAVFAMKIATATHLGDSVLLTGTAGDQPLRVRVPGSSVVDAGEGQEISVGWRPADVHLIPHS
ncbi:MAG TPA: ABC transporter ATP-binding protein [Gemmatimonadales bacterium]|nr:ABC transporter ATP-binding protein [Gemmatimonadales bacterium]